MRKQVRDLTERQFFSAVKRAGWEPSGFMGYVNIGHGVSVCRFNAGPRFREQLSYLQREADRAEAEAEARDK